MEADFFIAFSRHSGRAPKHYQSHINRELVRQALVISSLHFADRMPEDAVIDRAEYHEIFSGPVLDVHVEWTPRHVLHLDLRIRGNETGPRLSKKVSAPDTPHLSGIILELAEMIPEDLARFLRESIQKRTSSSRRVDVPDLNIEEVMWAMNPLDQFRALRYWHARASLEGLTEEILQGLVYGYANLGQLTRHSWNTFPFAASARSMLYAGLMRQLHGDTEMTVRTRAYAYTLGMYPHLAKAMFDILEDETDALTSTLQSFYRFDLSTLEAEAAGDLPHAQLSALLGMISVQHFHEPNYVTAIVDGLREFTPGNVRVLDISNQEVGVSRLHFATREGMNINRELFRSGIPGLENFSGTFAENATRPDPPSQHEDALFETLLLQALGLSPARPPQRQVHMEDQEKYRRLYRAAAEGPFAENGYPCWRVLGHVFWNTHFYNAALRLDFMARRWSVDTGNTLDELLPGFEGHPLVNVLKSYDHRLSEDEEEVRALLESVELRDAVPPMHPFLRHWANSRTEQFKDQSRRDALHNLFRGSHTDMLRFSEMRATHRGRIRNAIANDILTGINPYHPRALADKIQTGDDWEDIKRIADERLPGHPLIAGVYALRLRREGRPDEAIPFFEFAAAELGSKRLFDGLAAIYLERGDEEKWLEVRRSFDDLPDTALRRAANNRQIAYHFLESGRPREALPFAERAAASYSAWGLRVAATNHMILGNTQKGMEYLQARNRRYGTTLFRKMMNYLLFEIGDRDELRIELAEKPFNLQQYAGMRFSLGEFEDAAKSLAAVHEAGQPNYNLLHAALVNLHLNHLEITTRQLEQIMAEVIEDGPGANVYRANQSLAALFLRALDEEWPGEKFLARAETLRSEVLSSRVAYNTLFRFFTALFLVETGHADLAEGILTEDMHLNSRLMSHAFIASTLRRLGADPLQKFRENPSP